jgi:hypothetical protein
MGLVDELMHIENRLATGGGAEYREVLADDALVIVPGAVLDKTACVAAMDSSPGWDEVRLDDARLVEGAETATAVYRFFGRRGDAEYRATLASTYRLPQRELLLHQQTPDPSQD